MISGGERMNFDLMQMVRRRFCCRAGWNATVESLGPIIGLAAFLTAAFVSLALAASENPLAKGPPPSGANARISIGLPSISALSFVYTLVPPVFESRVPSH